MQNVIHWIDIEKDELNGNTRDVLAIADIFKTLTGFLIKN